MTVMPITDAEARQLAASWLAYQARCHAVGMARAEGIESWNRLTDMVWNDPESAWPVILLMIEAASTDSLLRDVAAGPLEELLSNHAHDFIDRIEDHARKDAKFRKCLCGVWGWFSIPATAQTRLQKYGWRPLQKKNALAPREQRRGRESRTDLKERQLTHNHRRR
jgi:hypothetical protein